MSRLDEHNPPAATSKGEDETFQSRVKPWMHACFGDVIPYDQQERCDRFIEEALELVQVFGYERDRIVALVDYVFGRPVGELEQEVGGVMVTLAALCLAVKVRPVDMHDAGERELARIWTKVEAIRAKQAAKPRGIALPIDPLSPPPTEAVVGSSAGAESARKGPTAFLTETQHSAGVEHAPDCQSHIVDVRGRPDPCTCGADPDSEFAPEGEGHSSCAIWRGG